MAAPYGAYPVQQPPVMGLYNRTPVLAFGILQLLFGVFMIITDIVNFCISWYSAVEFSAGGSGFYAGVFFIITASFGIAAGRPLAMGRSPRSRKCLLITSLVMSILSTIMATALVIVLAVLLSNITAWRISYYCSSNYNYSSRLCYVFRYYSRAIMGTHLAFQSVMWIFSLAQAITAGINLCKLPKSKTATQVVYVQPGYGYPQGVPFHPTVPGQPVYFVPGQPAVMADPPVQMVNPDPAPVVQKS
ncbi:uncharacterized protein LOC129596467 [Paramacrobiotus metropolitanus]|uniref:uncharacterized protein LOC129596467 n=1 Tax=Paramacrobiotus metropolitanus TaxID=2943436 RepID=UPI002445B9F5|nr:uncharacterized protein LOC129596467 [Paramacrobiotus metropolitanus]